MLHSSGKMFFPDLWECLLQFSHKVCGFSNCLKLLERLCVFQGNSMPGAARSEAEGGVASLASIPFVSLTLRSGRTAGS